MRFNIKVENINLVQSDVKPGVDCAGNSRSSISEQVMFVPVPLRLGQNINLNQTTIWAK